MVGCISRSEDKAHVKAYNKDNGRILIDTVLYLMLIEVFPCDVMCGVAKMAMELMDEPVDGWMNGW